MRSPKPILRILAAGVALVFVLSFGPAGMAQSGRRVKKTTPAPVPTPEAASSPAKSAKKPEPAVRFVVGMDRYSLSVDARASYWSGTLASVVDRLNDSAAVEVTQVSKSMTRGEAVSRAKSEKGAYVVWLELRNDSRTASSRTDYQVYIQYWVFSPTTAKLKTSGNAYPQAYRNRGVIVSPRTSNIYDDYQLQQAAREAAERILDAFKLHLPDRPMSLPNQTAFEPRVWRDRATKLPK